MVTIAGEFFSFVQDLASSTGITAKTLSTIPLPQIALDIISRRLATGGNDKAKRVQLQQLEKRRYIVAPPLYQQSAGPTIRDSLRTVHDTLKTAILRSEHETGPKVMKLSPLEAAVLKERFRGLLIEEDIQYRLPRTPLLGEIDPIAVTQSAAKKVELQVQSNGKPIAEARVVLFTEVAKRRAYEGTSDAEGRVTLAVRKADTRFQKVVVLPRWGFWSRVWKNVPVSMLSILEVAPLPATGFAWGHQATEARAKGSYLGKGVKVAIIDTGIARHPSLKVVDGKNFIEGENAAAWDYDVDGHGTHCAGVVAAVQKKGSVWGYAPQASLYALRVFGGIDGGGYASDIGDAIDWAVQKGCDILSMSLTSATASSYMRQRIEKAVDAGVLCVAAAGNDGGPVCYPAKFRHVVGVSAIGKIGTYPPDSIHSEAESAIKSADGQYFLASFSNHGEEVDLCAPGVAITSTLPLDVFGASDGTSMACPHITGIAALALQASPTIRHKQRNAERMGLLLDRVSSLCTDLGMGRNYQGYGLPLVSQLK